MASKQLEGYTARPCSETRQTEFSRAETVLRPGKDYRATLSTRHGDLVIELYQDQAPHTVNNFVFLALHRFYDGVAFHRVLADFMAQTGDPTGTGRGGPGYRFEDEFHPALRHDKKGVLSMANAGPNTNGSQFFITFQPTPWLDGKHAVFGQVIEGLEVLDALTHIDPQRPSGVKPDVISRLAIVEK
ncbi:MAG: peptidylprolyl isomerase [Truepera sp.]|nr:peptidylprolyl isomerase [Truepera sp.]